jgi:glucose/arabinose dehydrogenase
MKTYQGLCLIMGCLTSASFVFAGDRSPDAVERKVLKGKEAFGDWTDDAPGVRRHITIYDIPRPNETKSADNGPKLVPRPKDAWPKAPAGFKVELIAEKLTKPRKIIAAPNGDLFVAESEANRITILRQGDDGKVETKSTFAGKLAQPFGIAFYPLGPEPQYVYIANTDSLVRFDYQNGDLKARGEPKKLADLPGGGKLRGGGHWTRDIVFRPDGKKMLVSVGSHSNNTDDEAEKHRADVLEYNPDGSGFRVFAWGIRNAVGLAFEPKTGALWGSVNERDGLGDDLAPDYITHIQEGGFYGWPWYYIGNHPDPSVKAKNKHPELAERVIVPDVLVQAHMASLCMMFYTADQFPGEYHGEAFAAQHGSWNRASRTGYKFIRVPLKNGKATGEYEDFLTGFVTPEGNVWGRPVGVTADKSGALIVSDDGSNSIWRVSYTGDK